MLLNRKTVILRAWPKTPGIHYPTKRQREMLRFAQDDSEGLRLAANGQVVVRISSMTPRPAAPLALQLLSKDSSAW